MRIVYNCIWTVLTIDSHINGNFDLSQKANNRWPIAKQNENNRKQYLYYIL